ncbi:MAG: hypothetical protein ACKOPQ_12220 [Novosphingobium sp.]
MIVKSIPAAFACLAALFGASAVGANPIQLGSSVFVERMKAESRVLEPARALVSGDRIVTVLTWKRATPGGQFTVANALPRGLYYQGSASDEEEVSIDGGRTWGKLGQLRVGTRFATAEDVTHVRWRVQSQSATGRIAYSAIVR